MQSSRRLEREARRHLEVILLFGRLIPDDQVIADYRKDKDPPPLSAMRSSSSYAAR